MTNARVIPCLDVDAGRVVKGVNFVDLVDAGDPVELAARYDAEGADELVFLDITASSDARDTIVEVARHTAEEVFIPFTVGGGIRVVDDARRLLRAGADKVSVNTAAVERPGLLISEIAAEFGSQCAVVAIDARRSAAGGGSGFEVYTHGGRTPTGLDAVEWAKRAVEVGAGEILLTSMDRDGTRDGFDVETDPRHLRLGQRAGDRQRWGRKRSITWSKASSKATPTPCLAASIFHFAEHTGGRSQGSHGSMRGFRSALELALVGPCLRVSAAKARPPGRSHHVGSTRPGNGRRRRRPRTRVLGQVATTLVRGRLRWPELVVLGHSEDLGALMSSAAGDLGEAALTRRGAATANHAANGGGGRQRAPRSAPKDQPASSKGRLLRAVRPVRASMAAPSRRGAHPGPRHGLPSLASDSL